MAGSLTDIFAAMQNGVVAVSNFRRQLTGSLNNISAQLAVINASYVRSFNTRTGVVVPAQGDYSTNIIAASATNDAATAGNIGEFRDSGVIVSSNLTSGGVDAVASITCSPGNWEISCTTVFGGAGATSLTDALSAISTTSGSITATVGQGLFYRAPAATDVRTTQTLCPQRVSISSSTTYFLNVQAVFTVSTYSANCIIHAVRPR